MLDWRISRVEVRVVWYTVRRCSRCSFRTWCDYLEDNKEVVDKLIGPLLLAPLYFVKCYQILTLNTQLCHYLLKPLL